MNIAHTIFNLLSLTFCLGTASSVLIHDTNVDKAMVTAVTNHAQHMTNPIAKPGNDPHTHSERTSLHQAIRDLNASQPRVQPRNQDEKHYAQSKPSARGHHPFDNYTLPVVS